MTTIDHRILIPAGPEAVWEYVSDITHNPDWQIDCAEVIFLTSRREGPGVRWRYSAPNGHECVIAVTAWYNGLGYEYYYVDGVPYKENKGRIRLQEIPEGTIVQWTFTYEIGGLFGGMRNSLGVSRSVDFTISESLKTLYQKIKASGLASRPHESKSLMRDAPNVDARSAYQPRHPSVLEEEDEHPVAPRPPAAPSRVPIAPARPFEAPAAKVPPRAVEPPVREGDGQRIRVIAEPPLAEDDTRRRKAAAAQPLLEDSIPLDEGEPDFLKQLVDLTRFEPPRTPAAPAAVEPEPEPDFLKRIDEPPISKSDTQPRKPVIPAAAPPSTQEAAPPPVVPAAPFVPITPLTPTPALTFEPPPSAEDTEPVVLTASPFAPPEEPTAPAVQVPDETQADYITPARIYEWPRHPSVEPEPPRQPEPETSPFEPAASLPAALPETPPAPTADVEPFAVEVPLASAEPVKVEPEPEPPVAAAPLTPEAKPEVVAPPAPVNVEPELKPAEPPLAATVAPTPAPPQPSAQPKPAAETASIWEIFGVPRPSEVDAAPSAAPTTEQPPAAPVIPAAASTPPAAPVTPADAVEPAAAMPVTPAAAAPESVPEPEITASPEIVSAPPVAALPVEVPSEKTALPPPPSRAGLRLALRRKLVVVRRP